MALPEVVQLLLVESERQQLVERAFSEFDRWLEWVGGSISGVPRAALQVSFHEQSLVYRTEILLRPLHIATELAFEVWDSDEGVSGIYQLLTGLDGVAFKELASLDGPVSIEALRPSGAWRVSDGHYRYHFDLPRCIPELDPSIP